MPARRTGRLATAAALEMQSPGWQSASQARASQAAGAASRRGRPRPRRPHEPAAAAAAARPHPKGPQCRGPAEIRPLRVPQLEPASPQPHDATGSPQFGPRPRGSAAGWRGRHQSSMPIMPHAASRQLSVTRQPPLCRGSCTACWACGEGCPASLRSRSAARVRRTAAPCACAKVLVSSGGSTRNK